MYQCDRCYDRVARRELPACIEACPEEVQAIGPRDEIIAQAHALAREMNGFFYGEMENGGTNTIYVSPVPFEQLTAEVEKGQGRPNLDRFEDVMADYFLLGRKTERVAVLGQSAAPCCCSSWPRAPCWCTAIFRAIASHRKWRSF